VPVKEVWARRSKVGRVLVTGNTSPAQGTSSQGGLRVGDTLREGEGDPDGEGLAVRVAVPDRVADMDLESDGEGDGEVVTLVVPDRVLVTELEGVTEPDEDALGEGLTEAVTVGDSVPDVVPEADSVTDGVGLGVTDVVGDTVPLVVVVGLRLPVGETLGVTEGVEDGLGMLSCWATDSSPIPAPSSIEPALAEKAMYPVEESQVSTGLGVSPARAASCRSFAGIKRNPAPVTGPPQRAKCGVSSWGVLQPEIDQSVTTFTAEEDVATCGTQHTTYQTR
jgi:hypothetical protein